MKYSGGASCDGVGEGVRERDGDRDIARDRVAPRLQIPGRLRGVNTGVGVAGPSKLNGVKGNCSSSSPMGVAAGEGLPASASCRRT
jgi:hypothetical protein